MFTISVTIFKTAHEFRHVARLGCGCSAVSFKYGVCSCPVLFRPLGSFASRFLRSTMNLVSSMQSPSLSAVSRS